MRPQDILIILKLIAHPAEINKGWFPQRKGIGLRIIPKSIQNKSLASALHISEAEVSESLRRSVYAGLLTDPKQKNVNKKALLEFLLTGLKYVFPSHPGALARGVPTAHSAPPLNELIVSDEKYVWQSAKGTMRGQAIEPLYPTVPVIAPENSQLYELLALTDAIRTGSARTVSIASEELEKRIMSV